MKEILLVAPYGELVSTAEEIISKKGYENIQIITSDLCSTAHVDGLSFDSNVSVIISRGGTYKMIKNRIQNVSVIELETSVYDIISSIKDVIDREEPTAVIGFDNIISGLELLDGLKRLNIHKIKMDASVPMVKTIADCVQKGIKIFIGDTYVEKTCKELGYECHLIKNGKASISNTLKRAQEIIEANKNEIERNKRYEALIDCVNDGVIAIDENNNVLECNLVAREI
ncbi:MAG: PrpR N-terminal domain-containing protein, partial [Anaerotignaceae bacterium]